jgi:hypothetical protein
LNIAEATTWGISRNMKFVATFGLPLLLLASTVAAECAESEPSRVFSYSVGEKRVSVSKSGDRFFYHFGAARKDEMSIVGVPATGNIFQESQRFTGPECQLIPRAPPSDSPRKWAHHRCLVLS